MAEAFVPGYFEGAVVNHIDGNNRNNHYANLEWVTQKENIFASYKTSGIDQTRNCKWWDLISPDGKLIGTFQGHYKLEKYIKENFIDASPSMLTKHHRHNGYSVIVRER